MFEMMDLHRRRIVLSLFSHRQNSGFLMARPIYQHIQSTNELLSVRYETVSMAKPEPLSGTCTHINGKIMLISVNVLFQFCCSNVLNGFKERCA